LNNLGIAYRRARNFSTARETFQAAIHIDPSFAAAHYNLGNVHRDEDNMSAARDAFDAANRLKPDYADAHAARASLAESEHDLAQAKTSADRAIAIDPGNAVAHLTLARIDLREDRPQAAAVRMNAMLARPQLAATNRVIAGGLLGQAEDRLAHYSEAFAAFSAANALQRERFAAPSNSLFSPQTIQRLTVAANTIDIKTWSQTPGTDDRAPVFFVGFPRSGTTLIEQILGAHSGIATIEEKDILAGVLSDLILHEHKLASLAALPPEDIEQRRANYWRAAVQLAKGNSAGIVVDKLPLNTVLIGPALRLFPSAKIIFALRDPRDVVLSCFQQTFDMNAAMFEFLSLENAARYYDAVMRLFSVYREKLSFPLHIVRYEDLLADFDREVGRLLGFLGLPWRESVRNYRETAKKRLINTPSASQVVRPLYTTARGKWRNYRAELEPVLPLLEPWVKAFGYDPA
jgi:tetratricopeptide (TPR) repeat protein